MEKKKGKNIVFYVSLAVVGIVAIWSVAFSESFAEVANAAFGFLTVNFGWLYMNAMVVFLVFVVYLACSKYGKIRLGGDDSKPEYSYFSWFGLLFGCGTGVGLVFWGVAEPLTFYLHPNNGIEPASQAAADFAFENFFVHWGILPWANYAVISLAFAYFVFRKNKKGLISSMLEPLLGEKVSCGGLGKFVDVLAVFATMAGVATSLGLGTIQVNAGFSHLFGIPVTIWIQITIVVVIAILYIGSAVSGLDKGIKMISDANIYVAIGLLILAFLVGPKIEALNALTNALGDYVGNFFQTALDINSYSDNSWFGSWRLFYWAWFIAWAPFVGVFVARISKGRTIREFVLGVCLIPTLFSILWGTVFGNLGIHLAESGKMTLEALEEVVAAPEVGLFIVLEQYPLGFILSLVAILSLTGFFVTSANSGVYVLSMLSTDGDINPPRRRMVVWGVIQAVLAIGLLMAGGLKPLQTISLIAAFLFVFVMFAVMVSFIKALRDEDVNTNQ